MSGANRRFNATSRSQSSSRRSRGQIEEREGDRLLQRVGAVALEREDRNVRLHRFDRLVGPALAEPVEERGRDSSTSAGGARSMPARGRGSRCDGTFAPSRRSRGECLSREDTNVNRPDARVRHRRRLRTPERFRPRCTRPRGNTVAAVRPGRIRSSATGLVHRANRWRGRMCVLGTRD